MPRAKLPQSANLMGKSVKIVYVDLSAEELFGDFNQDKCLIRIHSKLKKADKMHTLHHELVHAVLAFSGLNNLMSSELEESIARAMDVGRETLELVYDVD